MSPSGDGKRRLARIWSYADAQRQARRSLPRALYQYVEGGSEGETTLMRNLTAFETVEYRPRMGRWTAEPELRTSVLGTELAFPVLTAPCGGLRLVNPVGDVGMARGARQCGIEYVCSASSGYSLETIAADAGPGWFQLYRLGNRAIMENLVERARLADFPVLVVTVDTAVVGNRERDTKNGFSYAMRLNAANAVRLAPQLAVRPGWVYRYVRDGMPFGMANTAALTGGGKPLPLTEMARPGEPQSATWDDVRWLRENWSGKLVIKGVLTDDDARVAVDFGADGIIVSNHGGRQLDRTPATLEALPGVVDAVGDRVDVLLDSGVRRGSDVVAALALGAKAVLVGRMPIWGLAVAGQAGVRHMLSILRTDVVRTLQLMGAASVHELDRSWLSHESLHG